MALTACTQTKEDMLVGKWQVNCVTETIQAGGQTSTTQLPGYDNYTMEFVEEGYCAATVRGERTIYTWYLVDDNTLVLTLDDWAEDYTINELTKNRLVYSDTYSDGGTDRTYTFEYSKL